jgi:hypothetical protein
MSPRLCAPDLGAFESTILRSTSRCTGARHLLSLSSVPLLRSLIGGSAAFFQGVWQDIGLLVGGLIAVSALLASRSSFVHREWAAE